jgi:hypothetical protein
MSWDPDKDLVENLIGAADLTADQKEEFRRSHQETAILDLRDNMIRAKKRCNLTEEDILHIWRMTIIVKPTMES